MTVAAPVDFIAFNKRTKTPLLESDFDFVQSIEQYKQLTDPYQYEILLVRFGGDFISFLLNDQAKNNKNLKWVHSMTAGIEQYIAAEDFTASEIQLTNVKGAFSLALAEFVALGILYFAKCIPSFLDKQNKSQWQP